MKHRKKREKHPLHRLMKGSIVVPMLVLVLIGFAVMLTSGTLVNRSATDPTEQFGEAEVSLESGKQNLQLKNLSFKPKPPPVADTCNHDMRKPIDDLDKCK